LLQQHGSFGRAGAGNAPGAASKPGPSIGAAVATRVVSFSLDDVPQVSVPRLAEC